MWDHNSPDVLRYEPGNGAKQVEQVEQACVVRRLEGRELYELLTLFYITALVINDSCDEATNVSGELLNQRSSRSNCWFPIVHRTAPSSSTILPLAPLYLVLAI